VTLVDGDKISRTNCIRQPFSEIEVGLYKATVLATRINLFWGLDWEGVPEFIDEGWRVETDILMGCVDTRKSRRMIISTSAYENCHYWLDIGNNADSGQFVLGQPESSKNRKLQSRLPTVAELFPEIIDPALDRKDKLPPCSPLKRWIDKSLLSTRPWLIRRWPCSRDSFDTDGSLITEVSSVEPSAHEVRA